MASATSAPEVAVLARAGLLRVVLHPEIGLDPFGCDVTPRGLDPDDSKVRGRGSRSRNGNSCVCRTVPASTCNQDARARWHRPQDIFWAIPGYSTRPSHRGGRIVDQLHAKGPGHAVWRQQRSHRMPQYIAVKPRAYTRGGRNLEEKSRLRRTSARGLLMSATARYARRRRWWYR